MEEKKTVVLDFDGVIHSYKSGWQGSAIISDDPVPGIKKAIDEIRYCGYEVSVVSTRCATSWGKEAVDNWLRKYGIYVDRLCAEKPPAVCYVDDRAICFDGHPETLLQKIIWFKPWWEEDNGNL